MDRINGFVLHSTQTGGLKTENDNCLMVSNSKEDPLLATLSAFEKNSMRKRAIKN